MAVVFMSNPKELEVSHRIQEIAQELTKMTESMVRAENPRDINYGSSERSALDTEHKGPSA